MMSLLLSSLMVPSLLYAQDLSISPDDLWIIRQEGSDGVELFIRHKPDISSVLITESTRDPYFREANFAFRAAEWNEVNGDEIRLLDGVPIQGESGIYSLVSSTPRWDPVWGWVFHIYIPNRLLYGHEGGRQGEVYIHDGMYLNIRAFYYAFADYRGPFQDNPFALHISQVFIAPPLIAPPIIAPPPIVPPPPGLPIPLPGRRFLPETVESFTSLAGEENTSFAGNPTEMISRIRDTLEQAGNAVTDIAICLDVTGSMGPFFEEIRDRLIPMIREVSTQFEHVRLGMVLFRDYFDVEFVYRVIPFNTDFDVFQNSLNFMRARGGEYGGNPEAVYTALHAGATQLAWEGETRIMILIGDAPNHPRPRRTNRQMVDAAVVRQGIELHTIILPHD